MGDMGLEYGNEKRVCTPFDVVLAFFVSVLIVLKFVGEYGSQMVTNRCDYIPFWVDTFGTILDGSSVYNDMMKGLSSELIE